MTPRASGGPDRPLRDHLPLARPHRGGSPGDARCALRGLCSPRASLSAQAVRPYTVPGDVPVIALAMIMLAEVWLDGWFRHRSSVEVARLLQEDSIPATEEQ